MYLEKIYKIKKTIIWIAVLIVLLAILAMNFISNSKEDEQRKSVYINSIGKGAKNILNSSVISVDFTGKSLIVTDYETGETIFWKNESESEIPASLSKLFVIDYVKELGKLDEIVLPSKEAIKLAKEGSSLANIKNEKYTVKDLFAGMLVPSGNDSAYVIADYFGEKINKNARTTKRRIKSFLYRLKDHIRKSGYKNTEITDPSGFDLQSKTTAKDIEKVTRNLMKNQWFKEIVSKAEYKVKLENGDENSWKNTNKFLDKKSKFYNENVKGVKTGSLSSNYNLLVFCEKNNKKFIVCGMGWKTDRKRYEDMRKILDIVLSSAT